MVVGLVDGLDWGSIVSFGSLERFQAVCGEMYDKRGVENERKKGP